jgi:hypothetical protein
MHAVCLSGEAALMSALRSREGQAVAGDVPNYASGGLTLVHFPMTFSTASA